jgi:hypothetical protein
MEENFGKKIIKGNGKFMKQYFTIKNTMTNRVIDLKSDEKENDVAMSIGADGGRSQNFTFVRDGYDFYIKNKHESKYLTVDSEENGANVYGAKKEKGNKHQLFRIQKKDQSDVIFIRTFCDKVLMISTEGKGQKGHITQWKFTGDENQEWILVEPRMVDSSTD